MTVILTVQLPAGRHTFRRKHGFGPLISTELHRPLQTTVYRLARIVTVKQPVLTVIEVDAFIPDRHRDAIAPDDVRWVRRNVLRTRAYWVDNKRSGILRRFLASGEWEWDVRERT